MDLCLFGKKITHTQIIVNHYENSETLMCVLLFILLIKRKGIFYEG